MAQRVLLEVEPEWAEEESGWRSAEEILMAGRYIDIYMVSKKMDTPYYGPSAVRRQICLHSE